MVYFFPRLAGEVKRIFLVEVVVIVGVGGVKMLRT